GDRSKALENYEQSVDVYRKLNRDYPDNTEWHANLGWALSFAGDAHQAQGDAAKARRYFEECLEIAEQLFQQDPDNESRATDVLLAKSSVAELAAEPRKALAIYRDLH